MRRFALGSWILTGCTSGQMYWPGGADTVRTALVQVQSDGKLHRAQLLLSNGLFTCEHPDGDDPAEDARAIESLLAGACREGAAHLNLTLHRWGGSDWVGTYPGDDEASVSEVGSDRQRIMAGTWFGVDEAFLVGFGEVDRTYSVAAYTLERLGDGGEVDVRRDGDRWVGTWAFPGGFAGSFRATECRGPATLFALLQPTPQHVCP